MHFYKRTTNDQHIGRKRFFMCIVMSWTSSKLADEIHFWSRCDINIADESYDGFVLVYLGVNDQLTLQSRVKNLAFKMNVFHYFLSVINSSKPIVITCVLTTLWMLCYSFTLETYPTDIISKFQNIWRFILKSKHNSELSNCGRKNRACNLKLNHFKNYLFA